MPTMLRPLSAAFDAQKTRKRATARRITPMEATGLRLSSLFENIEPFEAQTSLRPRNTIH